MGKSCRTEGIKFIQAERAIHSEYHGVFKTWEQTGGYVVEGTTLRIIAREELNREHGSDKVNEKMIQEKVLLIKRLNNLKSDTIITGHYLATNEVKYTITELGLEQPLIDPIDIVLFGKSVYTLSKGIFTLAKTGSKETAYALSKWYKAGKITTSLGKDEILRLREISTGNFAKFTAENLSKLSPQEKINVLFAERIRKGADLMKAFGTFFTPGWPDAALVVGEGKNWGLIWDQGWKLLFGYAGYKLGNVATDELPPW
jgi:hypothetical protein